MFRSFWKKKCVACVVFFQTVFNWKIMKIDPEIVTSTDLNFYVLGLHLY